MARQFDWKPVDYGRGFRAEMPDAISLNVAPNQTVAFGTKPARGTSWCVSISRYEEATRTIYRFGRDTYGIEHRTAKDAMRAAEQVYLEEVGK